MTHQLPPNVPQFLFDDALIADHRRLTRRWLPATIYPKPILEPTPPHERCLCYLSVLPDPEGGYRMYYWKFDPPAPRRPSRSTISLATSRDGFHWVKPNLGIVEWEGSRDNNIVIASDWHMDGPIAVYDPGSVEPYKMLLFHIDLKDRDASLGIYSYTSVDGLRWKQYPGVRQRAFDRNNVMPQRVNGKWVNFTRPPPEQFPGRRVIHRSESEDFINWSEQELVLAPDLTDEPDVEFYGLSAFERHGWYIGTLEYWNSLDDAVETHLVVSRDTKHWLRTPPRPFIAGTYPWNRRWSICANTGPIIHEEQMVFYFTGRSNGHRWNTAQQDGVIGFASLELDRFCALEGTSGGVLETVPLAWPGGELLLNADSRGNYDRLPMPHQYSGQIEIEVLDAEGKPLPDWSGDNRAIWRGNTHGRMLANHEAIVTWPRDRKLDGLRAQTIRLRFFIKHARLFTFAAQTQKGTFNS